MSAVAIGVVLALIGLVLGFGKIAQDIRNDLKCLQIKHGKQYMGHKPMYRDLSLWEQLEVIMMPGLFMTIENAYASWIMTNARSGRLHIMGSEPLLDAKLRAELTALSRQLIAGYNGSVREYFSFRNRQKDKITDHPLMWN